MGVVKEWKKPQNPWVKVNIDAALFKDLDCTVMGCVVRGSSGQFIMAKHMKQKGIMSPREAEALYIRETLLWAREKNLTKCIFETNSHVLVQVCKRAGGMIIFSYNC